MDSEKNRKREREEEMNKLLEEDKYWAKRVTDKEEMVHRRKMKEIQDRIRRNKTKLQQIQQSDEQDVKRRRSEAQLKKETPSTSSTGRKFPAIKMRERGDMEGEEREE